ncbi:hypothetical protein F5B19DRAFT_473767 [Rostrohypoxylon terebratum]|nr:hypothetical protein F5B19DRAFT_473767 [Rostrohypoxylon terebratum]
MSDLLRIAKSSKVDPMTRVELKSRRYGWYHGAIIPMTAMSYYYFISFEFPSSRLLKRFKMDSHQFTSIFQIFKPYEDVIESVDNNSYYAGRVETFQVLLADPELAEIWGYSGIYLSVIYRSLSKLKSSFPSSWTDSVLPESPGFKNFDPMELAVGWNEGLQFLVDQGCHIGRAFWLACNIGDEKSASIMLSSRNGIFSLDYNRRVDRYGRHLLGTAFPDKGLWHLTAKELFQRRSELNQWLTSTLNLDSQFLGGILESVKITTSLQDQLFEKGNVPERLKCLDCTSPYGFLIDWHSECFDLDFYNILYDNGFVSMQELCCDGRTALADLCNGLARLYNHREWFEVVAWLVERGAEPDFSHGNFDDHVRWPHLQFYTAVATDCEDEEDTRIFGICKSTITTDFCQCSCSSKGCIPPFVLWSCFYARNCSNGTCRRRLQFRQRKVQHWLWMCGFKRHEIERSFEELCRRELFDRLGMRHICCTSRYYQSTEEKEELLSEDAPSSAELFWLVGIYKKIRKQLQDVTILRFWKLWWMAADDVILPLLPEEACHEPSWVRYENRYSVRYEELEELKTQIEQKRLDRWQYLRKEAGYGGLEDNQMFRFHFTRFWLLAKAHRQRLVSRKRRRLMARPRFILTKRK